MKVYLCGDKGCCPAIDISRKYVKIGEKGNLCTLKKKEWATLKRKIMSGEI